MWPWPLIWPSQSIFFSLAYICTQFHSNCPYLFEKLCCLFCDLKLWPVMFQNYFVTYSTLWHICMWQEVHATILWHITDPQKLINSFTPSSHNNIKPPHVELSDFYIAELTFATSCRRQWMGGSWRSERHVGVKGLTLSAPSSLLLWLPAKRQASWEWPKLFKL